MNVVSRLGLMQRAGEAKADWATVFALIAWYRLVRKTHWRSFEDVRSDFPSVDRVGHVLIFNISGNRFRLIVTFHFSRQNVHVKALLTHGEYDPKEWMKWS